MITKDNLKSWMLTQLPPHVASTMHDPASEWNMVLDAVLTAVAVNVQQEIEELRADLTIQIEDAAQRAEVSNAALLDALKGTPGPQGPQGIPGPEGPPGPPSLPGPFILPIKWDGSVSGYLLNPESLEIQVLDEDNVRIVAAGGDHYQYDNLRGLASTGGLYLNFRGTDPNDFHNLTREITVTSADIVRLWTDYGGTSYVEFVARRCDLNVYIPRRL